MSDDVNTTHIRNDNVNTSNNEHHNLPTPILTGNPGEIRELIPTYHGHYFNKVGGSIYGYHPATMKTNEQD